MEIFTLYHTTGGGENTTVSILEIVVNRGFRGEVNETLWLTQKAMAELFGVGISAISKHIKNIFEEGELDEEVIVSVLEMTTQHGAIAECSIDYDMNLSISKKNEQLFKI